MGFGMDLMVQSRIARLIVVNIVNIHNKVLSLALGEHKLFFVCLLASELHPHRHHLLSVGKSRLDTLHHRKSIKLIESYSLARLGGFPVSNFYLVWFCSYFNRYLLPVDWALNEHSDSAGEPVGGFKDVTVFTQLTTGTFKRAFILNGLWGCCHIWHQHLLQLRNHTWESGAIIVPRIADN